MNRAHRGLTLVEVVVAGAILTLLSLVLFGGVSLALRMSHENAELMQAEGVAWDAAWMAFNEDYDELVAKSPESPEVRRRRVTLAAEAAPELARYDTPPVLTVSTSRLRRQIDGRPVTFVVLEADVAWGPSAKRRNLSDVQRTFVYRGPLSRTPEGP